jgi:hypothetical protein
MCLRRVSLAQPALAKLTRPACALICAAALLLGLTSAADADVSPAAVQNLATDASSWNSEATTDIDWIDPDGSDPSPINNTLYTVDGSPTSGATVQSSPDDTEDLELSGLSDGIHHVWVWLEDADHNQDPSTAAGHRLHRHHTAADQRRQRNRLRRRHHQLPGL